MTKYEGHTPGPWKYIDGAILSDKINSHGNWHIAIIPENTNDPDCSESNPYSKEDKANARLIAAAPDLLAENERLKELLFRARNVFMGMHTKGAGVVAVLDAIKAELEADHGNK